MARRLTPEDVALAAQLAGVPPELALAIWQQESSSGSNTRISPKGAVGGFQVIPATFRRYMPDGNIHDPVDNMEAGLRVLADGLRRSNGDLEGAAQFYYHGKPLAPDEEGPNSGPGTPTTRQYGQQVVAKADEIRQRRFPRRPDGRGLNFESQTPQFIQPVDRGVEDFNQPTEPLLTRTQNDMPEIPGLTRPLNGSTYTMPMVSDSGLDGNENYDLDRYVRKLVNEEFKNNA